MAHSPTASTVTDGTFDYIANDDHRQDFDMGELNKTPINGLSGSYAISTVMNQPSSGSATSAAFTAIRASIPQNFKPAALSSFVPLSANSRSSVLAASHKRSAPPPIKLSDPPRVTHADFEPYLHQIQGEWARWEKNLNIGSGGAASLRQSEIVPAGSTAPIKFTTRQRSREPPQLSNVPSVFFDQSFSLANPTTFDIVTERIPAKKNGTTSFSKDSLLRLDPISIPDLATDQILHEKLSHYLNIVELNLVKEIGLRSSSFFSALGNLQSLHSQTASCMAQVDALSSELDQLRSNVAQKGLDMVQCGTRRRNIMKIERALLRVGEICQSVRDVGELVRGGDWNSALGLIEYLEKLWNSHGEDFSEPQHLPSDLPPSSLSLSAPGDKLSTAFCRLSKLRALKSLPNQLSNFRTVISKTLEQELVSILIHDLKVNVQGLTITGGKIVEKSEPSSPSHLLLGTMTRKSSSEASIRNLIKERLQERVRETFVGLIRASHIEKALALWKEGVLGEVRELVQNHLSEVSEADIGRKEKEIHSDKASSHTKDYKSLSHSEFLKFAQATYICLLECIEAVNIQSQALLEIAGEIKSSISKKDSSPLPLTGVQTNNSITTPLVIETQEMTSNYDTAKDDIMTLNLDIEGLTLKLCEIVQAAAELANVRFAKVVGTRTEIHANLKLFEFFEIFDVSWHFVVRCEVISRRMIVALRGVMAGQAQAFLKSFHQTKINESAKILEHELWAQVEVPPKINEVVSLIISSAVEDPKALKVNSMTSSSPEVEAVANNLTASPTKQLNVEGTLFHSVNAVLETLIVLKEYLQIVVNCPLLTTDVMAKILEFLKAFNSRTCQVVLGAGAMRSAGLKNITAKHLALASQAVSVMISLIPYIRECLRRHLSMKQAVMLVDFDKLKRDFQEHQNEIHAKLVSIMSDRLGVHVQSLKSIDWERHEDDSGEISHNAYVENLLKEVSTLHRVLSRYLSQSNLTFIMTQVLTAIHDELHKEFSLIEVRTVIAKNRLFADAKYFLKKVVELKSYEEIQARATELVEIVQRKPLPKGLEPDSIDTDSSKQPDSDPISPLAERAEQFKAKFRFLAPRKNSQTPLPVLPEALQGSKAEESHLSISATEGIAEVEKKNIDKDFQTQAEEIAPESLASQIDLKLDLSEDLSESEAQQRTSSSDLPPDADEIKETQTLDIKPNKQAEVVLSPPSQPRLSLSQRLAALAGGRRESIIVPPTPDQGLKSLTADQEISSAPDPTQEPAKEPRKSVELKTEEALTVPQQSLAPTPPRLSLKDRLAAIAARAASANSFQNSESPTEKKKMEPSDCQKPNLIPELIFPISTEALSSLPALPESPFSCDENQTELELNVDVEKKSVASGSLSEEIKNSEGYQSENDKSEPIGKISPVEEIEGEEGNFL